MLYNIRSLMAVVLFPILFCATCDNSQVSASLARAGIPQMPETCVVPTTAPELPNKPSYRVAFLAYAAAFRSVNREKVECGKFADAVLKDIRLGRK